MCYYVWRGGNAHLPHDWHWVGQYTNVDQHVGNPVSKVELAVIEAVSSNGSGIPKPEFGNRSADIDPGNDNGDPIPDDESKTDPESLCDTENTAVEQENREFGERDARGVEIYV